MKKLFSILLLSLFVFVSCSKNNDPVDNNTSDDLVVDASKGLTGTFIDFWGKEEWDQVQWDSHFQEMKSIGITTVIVQFVAYNDVTWFDSSNSFTSTKYKYALSRLLTAAASLNMSVYIGLYLSDEYWDNQTNVPWLQLHAARCKSIANEINTQFGSNKVFKGWYIPHEPEPYAYNSAELVASFRENFVDAISDNLHQLNNKPVSIAAFFNSELTSPAQLSDFMAELSQCNLQVIMLQDGVGVEHVPLNDVAEYYSAAANGLYTGNKNFTGEFWTDMETFETPQAPAKIDRVTTQLTTELAVPHVVKAVSFQYYDDMCPSGPYNSSAYKLRSDYVNYIKSLK